VDRGRLLTRIDAPERLEDIPRTSMASNPLHRVLGGKDRSTGLEATGLWMVDRALRRRIRRKNFSFRVKIGTH
jgi:hypothetical protein